MQTESERRKQARAANDARLQARPMESRAVVKARAERYAHVARCIYRGLHEGAPFDWKGSEYHLIGVAETMGFTLVTLSRAERLGFTLKKAQKPVGTVYFTAPISKYKSVYVLECQFNRSEARDSA